MRALPARAVVVVAAVPARVLADRRDLGSRPGDLVGRRRRGRAQQQQPLHPLGRHHGPLDRPHAAHRAAEHGGPAVDPHGVGEALLDRDLVAHRRAREPRAPRAPVGSRARRSRRALAPAEDVGRDDEPAVGVDRPTRPDDRRPPARGGVPETGVPGDVAVAGERVQHEDGVGPVEPSPRLVGDAHVGQGLAALERHRAEVDEATAADRVPLPPRTGGGREDLDGRVAVDALRVSRSHV